MEHRDRARGWQHAKLSGHKNEDLIKLLLDTDATYASNFLERIGFGNETISKISIGGLHETNVPSVIGKRKTKSKTDLKIFLESGKTINVSIKKSLGGQVYFVRAGLFIETFEKQFGKKIPNSVQRAINLFWATADDAISIIEQFADKTNKKNYDLQIRHKSLNATTLKTYDENLYHDLLAWFTENAFEIAQLSFSMGAAKEDCEWSDYIWYINLLGEHKIDEISSINDICTAVKSVSSQETYYGASNGGTTIQLPFGFVQWHQKQLQFHHNYSKLKSIL